MDILQSNKSTKYIMQVVKMQRSPLRDSEPMRTIRPLMMSATFAGSNLTRSGLNLPLLNSTWSACSCFALASRSLALCDMAHADPFSTSSSTYVLALDSINNCASTSSFLVWIFFVPLILICARSPNNWLHCASTSFLISIKWLIKYLNFIYIFIV